MKKRDPLIWSNILDVDEILRGLVLGTQQKILYSELIKNFIRI